MKVPIRLICLIGAICIALLGSLAAVRPWFSAGAAAVRDLSLEIQEREFIHLADHLRDEIDSLRTSARHFGHLDREFGIENLERDQLTALVEHTLGDTRFTQSLTFVDGRGRSLVLSHEGDLSHLRFRVHQGARGTGQHNIIVTDFDRHLRPIYESVLRTDEDPRQLPIYQAVSGALAPIGIGEGEESELTNQLTVGLPLPQHESDAIAVLAADLSLALHEDDLIVGPVPHNTVSFFIVNEIGTPVSAALHPEISLLSADAGELLRQVSASALEARFPNSEGRLQRNVAGLMSMPLSPLLPGWTIVGVPGGTAEAGLVDAMSTQVAMGAGAAILLAGALAWCFGNRWGNRLHQLRVFVESSGEGEPVTSPAHGIASSEFDALASAASAWSHRTSTERLGRALTMRASLNGIVDVDCEAGEVTTNDRFVQITGCTSLDGLEDLVKLVESSDRGRVGKYFDDFVQQDIGVLDVEFRTAEDVQPSRWMHLRAAAQRADDGRPTRVVVIASDASVEKETASRLLHEAYHDLLTGLPNRILFLERIGWALDRMKMNPGSTAAVISMDLDGFRVVNDNLGQSAGDDLLVAVARRLSAAIGDDGLAARIGSDQFALLCYNAGDADTAMAIAEKIKTAVGARIFLAGQEVNPTASIGVAICDPGYARAESVISDANLAMVRAKEGGRGRILVFERRMRGPLYRRAACGGG